MDGTDIEIDIHVHPWVVPYFYFLLLRKHACCRTKNRSIIACEVTHIYANLRIQCLKPCTMVVQAVLQYKHRSRHHRVVGRVLKHCTVLEVNPGCSDVQS